MIFWQLNSAHMNSLKGLLTILTILTSLVGCSQGQSPNDYHNGTVQDGQLSTTKQFLRSIEAGDLDPAYRLIDPAYLAGNPNVKKELKQVSSGIQKFKDKATVSEGLIVYEEGHNVYRCTYYDEKVDYQLIDLHFQGGDPNSKIVKIRFKDRGTLMKEKAEREGQKDSPPPPPPF